MERQGSRGTSTSLVVLVRSGPGRVGLTVSRKVGIAVVRNRVKRLLRDILRHERALFRGCDAVIIVKPEAAGLSREPLATDLRAAFERARRPREKHAQSNTAHRHRR